MEKYPKYLELWCYVGDLESNNFNSTFETITSVGHVGFSFDNLSINNINKKIYGFRTTLNFPFDMIKLFNNNKLGKVHNDTNIFRELIEKNYTVFLINTIIENIIYEKFYNYSLDDFPREIYGIKSPTNIIRENCLTYLVKHLNPLILLEDRKTDTNTLIYISDFNGFLSNFIDFLKKKNYYIEEIRKNNLINYQNYLQTYLSYL